MVSEELQRVILTALKLDQWEFSDETLATEVPGWDSLNHVTVILAVEQHFGVRFSGRDVLRLRNIGELQRLVDAKRAEKRS